MAVARCRGHRPHSGHDHTECPAHLQAAAERVFARGGRLLPPTRRHLPVAAQRRVHRRRPAAHAAPGGRADLGPRMGFLSLDAFSIGAALLVAVLATYLLKPSRPTRRVSSTFLWLAAFHEMQADRPWRRVPPSLLLLLQLLALGAIIAALARPFTLSADTSGLDAIVVLDTSASTQAMDVPPSRFEAARQRVAQLVDALQPGETLSLIALGAEPRLVAPRT